MPDACHYISEHSKAEVVVLENNKQLAKYAQIASRLPNLKAIVIWEEQPDPSIAERTGKSVHHWNDFLKLGRDVPDSALDSRMDSIRPGHCASLIYTSGTTGPPKAVMISHDNITWTASNICEHYMDLNHTDRVVSYLPLSHIAAQLIDIYCMIHLGGCTYFAQPDALKGTLTTTLKEVRPTFFFGVPRVWEKIQEKLAAIGRNSTGIKKTLGTWAKNIGTEKSKLSQFGASGGAPFGYGCANSLILSKIREALGLDKTKACFTAAAPIAAETLWYFASLDIPVFEVFGQSECTGPHTVSAAKQWKIGTCGRPMEGTVSRIDPHNGELCYRGRHIFMGYMYMEKETSETIDDEGFLHSGDVAEFDSNDEANVPKPSGFMKITGRIKELIITAGGENIPPVLIENEMKAAMLAIANVMVIGDRRKFLSMLVSLKVEMDPETQLPTDRLAADALFVGHQIGSSATSYSKAKTDPVWADYINKGMKQANGKTTSNAQIVQKWRWLPQDFSEKEGELTPTLKLKRKVVIQKYSELIESIYAEPDNSA
jgi:long-chain-fatty-acid--CoA ligase ACSBG